LARRDVDALVLTVIPEELDVYWPHMSLPAQRRQACALSGTLRRGVLPRLLIHGRVPCFVLSVCSPVSRSDIERATSAVNRCSIIDFPVFVLVSQGPVLRTVILASQAVCWEEDD